jgi:putative membrane protein insertion efficiency factor
MCRFFLISALVFLLLVQPRVSACQSCLLPPLHRIQHSHSHPTSVALFVQQRQQLPALLGATTLKSLQQQGSRIVIPVAICVGVLATQRFVSSTLARGLRVEQEDDARDQDGEEAPKEEKPVSSAMVATIGVYKNFISPLLPPACRFLPTCSQYGVQAIEEFGPSKGSILTAWRLMRCSPFGGKGYDPPKWPPVSYTYGSY